MSINMITTISIILIYTVPLIIWFIIEARTFYPRRYKVGLKIVDVRKQTIRYSYRINFMNSVYTHSTGLSYCSYVVNERKDYVKIGSGQFDWKTIRKVTK